VEGSEQPVNAKVSKLPQIAEKRKDRRIRSIYNEFMSLRNHLSGSESRMPRDENVLVGR